MNGSTDRQTASMIINIHPHVLPSNSVQFTNSYGFVGSPVFLGRLSKEGLIYLSRFRIVSERPNLYTLGRTYIHSACLVWSSISGETIGHENFGKSMFSYARFRLKVGKMNDGLNNYCQPMVWRRDLISIRIPLFFFI